jgi:hypothetical protein
VTWLRFLDAITLGAEVVDLVEHSLQQCLGGSARYSSPLKLLDFTPLSLDLVAHALDFGADELDIRHSQPLL